MACVLEAGEGGGALKRLAQRVDSLQSVRAKSSTHPAEHVVGEAAKVEEAQRVKGC
mgnify:CR=1 FL=1